MRSDESDEGGGKVRNDEKYHFITSTICVISTLIMYAITIDALMMYAITMDTLIMHVITIDT